MSGMHLPPAEPPDEDLADLAEMVRLVRQHLTDAENQEALLRRAVADSADTPTRAAIVQLAYYGVELILAERRVSIWRDNLKGIEQAAHDRGLIL